MNSRDGAKVMDTVVAVEWFMERNQHESRISTNEKQVQLLILCMYEEDRLACLAKSSGTSPLYGWRGHMTMSRSIVSMNTKSEASSDNVGSSTTLNSSKSNGEAAALFE